MVSLSFDSLYSSVVYEWSRIRGSCICKYAAQGNPIDRYDCGKYPIYSFTVTEDDRTIYAVAAGEDGEHILIDIEL